MRQSRSEHSAEDTAEPQAAPDTPEALESRRRDVVAAIVLAGLMAAYCVLLGGLSLSRYARYGGTTFDVGIYDQAVWLISRGGPLFMTTRGLHVFADHCCPILFLLAPLYWLPHQTQVLLLVQTIALATGAIPAYLIARRHVGSRATALLFAAAYLAHPAIGWMNVFDFHPDALATTPLLWALWAVEARRPRALFPALVLFLMCKQTAGLIVVTVGLYAIRPMGRRIGWSIAGLGVFWFACSMLVIRHFNHGAPSAYVALYDQYGGSAGQMATFLATHPGLLAEDLLTPRNLGCLLQLALPFVCLCVLAPRTLLVATPIVLSNLLSNRPQMQEVTYQYNAFTIPVFYLAAVQGGATFLRWWGRPVTATGLGARVFLEVALLAGIWFAAQGGPFFDDAGNPHLATIVSADLSATLNVAVAHVPPDASVSAQTALAAHMAHRRFVYMYPNPFREACWGNSATALRQELGQDLSGEPLPVSLARIHARKAMAEYVVLAPATSQFPTVASLYQLYVRPILVSPDYGIVWAREDVVVLRRDADHARGLRLLREKNTRCPVLLAIAEGRSE